MRNRALRPVAAVLSILFSTGVPTKAGPVVVSDVIQVLSNYTNPPDLRVRSVSRTSMAVSSGVRSNVVQSNASNSPDDGQPTDSVLAGTGTANDSLFEGVALPSIDQNVGVDIIDTGDVEGTVCDCGEIPIKGGFPWWPFLFLAAVPLFFIHDCDDCVTPTPTPKPPPPSEAPEPASLLLFGSGLVAFGAGLRRRYAKAKLAAQIKATEEG